MKIKALYTYPIKSLRGCALDALPATYQGFVHDRRFMLLRAHDRKNMHVAHFPEMCLFTTDIVFPTGETDTGKIIVTFNPPTPNEFSPSHTEKSSIDIPLQPDVEGLLEEKVVMHSSPTVGFNMGAKYNEWFSERLGYDVIFLYIGTNRRECLGGMPPRTAARIMRERELAEAAQEQHGDRGMDSEVKRQADSGWLTSITGLLPSIPFLSPTTTNSEEEYPGVDMGIGFADVAPYLIVSTKSWENAQARLPPDEAMDITKFRPNIVVEGAEQEYEEDYWAELEVFPLSTPQHRTNGMNYQDTDDADDADDESTTSKPARFVLSLNCGRCNSLNVDYSTGKVGTGEAGKILKKLQSDRRVDPGTRYNPIFGRYAFLDRLPRGSDAVTLKIGDEIKVTRRNTLRMKWLWPNLGTSN